MAVVIVVVLSLLLSLVVFEKKNKSTARIDSEPEIVQKLRTQILSLVSLHRESFFDLENMKIIVGLTSDSYYPWPVLLCIINLLCLCYYIRQRLAGLLGLGRVELTYSSRMMVMMMIAVVEFLFVMHH